MTTKLNRFCCVCGALLLLAPAVSAQRQLVKGGKQVVKVLSGSPKNLPSVTRAASRFPATVKATQLRIQFPKELIQLELNFPNTEMTSSLSVSALTESIAKKMQKTVNTGASAETADISPLFTTPQGETVRKVLLGAEHFVKKHNAVATMSYLKKAGKSYTLRHPDGVEFEVALNDKLRFFSDLNVALRIDDFLVKKIETGIISPLPYELAPTWLKEGFNNAYSAQHPTVIDTKLMPEFIVEEETMQAHHFSSMKTLLENKSIAVLSTDLPAHPITRQPVQVYRLIRRVSLEGVGEVDLGSLVVCHQDGTFDLHPYGEIPPVLENSIFRVRTETPVLEIDLDGGFIPSATSLKEKYQKEWVRANFPLNYESQQALAQDLHAFYEGKGRHVNFLGKEAILYEIPIELTYKPAGRQEEVLEAYGSRLVVFSNNNGKLINKDSLPYFIE